MFINLIIFKKIDLIQVKTTITQQNKNYLTVFNSIESLNKNNNHNNKNKRISDNHYYFPLSEIESIDIDNEFDLKVARLIAEK